MQGVVNAIFAPPNIYADLIIQPMAMYYWASKEWLPLLATEWSFQNGDTFQRQAPRGRQVERRQRDHRERRAGDLLLRPADGGDGLGLHRRGHRGRRLHRQLPHEACPRRWSSATCSSSTPSPPSTTASGRRRRTSSSAAASTLDDPEGKQLLDQFVKFRPDNVIASGPFMFDVNSFTVSQNTLLKNEQCWNANDVKFDRIINYQGETSDITPVVLSGDVDYATHGFPPATVQQFLETPNMRVLRPPDLQRQLPLHQLQHAQRRLRRQAGAAGAGARHQPRAERDDRPGRLGRRDQVHVRHERHHDPAVVERGGHRLAEPVRVRRGEGGGPAGGGRLDEGRRDLEDAGRQRRRVGDRLPGRVRRLRGLRARHRRAVGERSASGWSRAPSPTRS